jgi:hypothetical protein
MGPAPRILRIVRILRTTPSGSSCPRRCGLTPGRNSANCANIANHSERLIAPAAMRADAGPEFCELCEYCEPLRAAHRAVGDEAGTPGRNSANCANNANRPRRTRCPREARRSRPARIRRAGPQGQGRGPAGRVPSREPVIVKPTMTWGHPSAARRGRSCPGPTGPLRDEAAKPRDLAIFARFKDSRPHPGPQVARGEPAGTAMGGHESAGR